MGVVSKAERVNIFKLVAGMFNAAPGAGYLQEFSDAFDAMGHNFAALAQALGNTAAFKSLYPDSMSAGAFANQFLQTLGLQANQEAQAWVVAHLNAGKSHAQVMLDALVAIVETTDPAFAAAQKLLSNKAAVAEYFSVTQQQSSESMNYLQAVLSKVQADSNVSGASALNALIEAGTAGVAQQPALIHSDGSQARYVNLAPVQNVEIGAWDAQAQKLLNHGEALLFQTSQAGPQSTLNVTLKAGAINQEIASSGYGTLNLKVDAAIAQAQWNRYVAVNVDKVVMSGQQAVKPGSGDYASADLVPASHWTQAQLSQIVVTGGANLGAEATNRGFSLWGSSVTKLLDFSNFQDHFYATLGVTYSSKIAGVKQNTGDHLIKVGAYGMEANSLFSGVTTFKFTKDVLASAAAPKSDFAWKINGFTGIGEYDAYLNGLTVLDMSALGLRGLQDLSLTQTGQDTVINGKTGQNFKIVLSGQSLTEVGAENFVFA